MSKPTQPSGTATQGGQYTVPAVNGGLTCAPVRDFVVVGGLVGDRYSIQWNAIGDITDWPIPATDDARSKQAGKQTFPTEHGFVTAIAGNDFYAYVFQERAITKMTYVGGDIVFSFDTFEEDRGCRAQGLYAQIDDKVFFESDRGKHMVEHDQVSDISFGATT